MKIPSEPIGSVPRPAELIAAMTASQQPDNLQSLFDRAVADTIGQFEATGSPVITDGEQTKTSFLTYPLSGLANVLPGGIEIGFADGHVRQVPVLTQGPFRYARYADEFLTAARQQTTLPVKQAVISASALSLIYPAEGIDGYPREAFIADLIDECETDIRRCLERGAIKVQMDFTEGRLSLKLDPSGGLLNQFIDLNNAVFDRFSPDEQQRIGVHACPGGDHDSTHSADVDYTQLLPALFGLRVGNFYLQLASEPDHIPALTVIRQCVKPNQLIFVGVVDVINATIETPEMVKERVLEAAQFIPIAQLGTTDDCGFSPFCDDQSTSRETAFAKIKARIDGTRLAEEVLFAAA